MTTSSQAYNVVRALLTDNKPAAVTQLRWQNVTGEPLPDEAAPFVYTEFLVDTSGVIEIGGGRGSNRHRNKGRVDIFVFVPKGRGVTMATDIAETIGTLFRPFNSSGVCVDAVTVSPGGDGAQLKPKGLTSLVDNYFYATVAVDFHSDQIG